MIFSKKEKKKLLIKFKSGRKTKKNPLELRQYNKVLGIDFFLFKKYIKYIKSIKIKFYFKKWSLFINKKVWYNTG